MESLQSSLVQAVILAELDLWLVTGTDDEDVRETCGELLASRVPDVDDVEATAVPDSVSDHTDSADIVSTGNVGDVAWLWGKDGLGAVELPDSKR